MKCEYGVILITPSITCLYFLTINTEIEFQIVIQLRWIVLPKYYPFKTLILEPLFMFSQKNPTPSVQLLT